MNPDKLKLSTTTDGKPPRPGFEDAPTPAPYRADGQAEAYWVLSEEERAKGFVRPVRKSYRHVGVRPTRPLHLRDLTPDEHARYDQFGYVKYEPYPCAVIVDPGGPTPACGWPSDNERHVEGPDFLHEFANADGSSVVGTFWTEKRLNSGCGTITSMGRALAETWARDVSYYGSTFCVACRAHFPVDEFVWMNERGVDGTDRLGT